MIDVKKYDEKYIWRVHLKDQDPIDEFYEKENKLIETSFSKVNNNKDFEKLELVSNLPEFKDTNISINNKGEFSILNQIMYFNLIDENNKDLLEGFHNNLMMFRTDASFPNGKVIRYGYTIGYKVINDDIFARVKFTTGAEGVQFKLEITAKREFKDKIKLVYNSSKDNNTPQVLSQYIKLIKDKTVTVTIK